MPCNLAYHYSKIPHGHRKEGRFGQMEKVIAFFYCQNTPGSTEVDRQVVEKKYGNNIRLFPMPCGGRFEPVHVMRALESFADAAYVITCPVGTCRYFEGNLRAQKRMMRTKELIESIGLERDRVDIYVRSGKSGEKLANIVEELLDRASSLPGSPVFKKTERLL